MLKHELLIFGYQPKLKTNTIFHFQSLFNKLSVKIKFTLIFTSNILWEENDECIPTIAALNGGTAFKFIPFFTIVMLIKQRVLIGFEICSSKLV